jgi:dTDP-glucose 4,6-dehydratase/UDP-glucose 4-epimerase
LDDYDICLNASGSANVQFSFENPQLDYRLNTANVYYILDAIRQYNPSCKFINLSSAAVYGNSITLPINETAELAPISPYGRHKAYSENICREFFEVFNVETVSLRIFSAYGDGLRKQLLWDVVEKIKNSSYGEIELFGTGRETRDYIYISDLIRAIDCIISYGQFYAQPVNIASGIESTVSDVATIIAKKLGADVRIKFGNQQKAGDPLNWRADITALLKTGFVPEVSLPTGINNYVKWLKEEGYF